MIKTATLFTGLLTGVLLASCQLRRDQPQPDTSPVYKMEVRFAFRTNSVTIAHIRGDSTLAATWQSILGTGLPIQYMTISHE